MFHQHILIYNSYKGYNKHRRLKICCAKSRIVLEGKNVVLISSLSTLFIMLLEKELFGKVINL